LSSGEVAFRIAPRINAAGRMDIARDVVELFSVKESAPAREIAQRLDKLNTERQEEERRIVESIDQKMADDVSLQDAFCTVIDGDGWHRGVIGITATRVVERYGRPALVISVDGEEAHGSGRSIPAFHLLNALESCGQLFTRFGGHSHAVGFSLPSSRIPELRAQLDAYARTCLKISDFEPVLHIDAKLPLDVITPELLGVLCRIEPFGAGNPEPIFFANAVRLTAQPKILKEKHAVLKLSPATTIDAGWRRSLTYKAMGWRLAEKASAAKLLAGDRLDVAFTLDHNEHPDFGGIELSLRDFNATASGPSARAAEQS
jgi:single-stranded-DNA-specific exonuclease